MKKQYFLLLLLLAIPLIASSQGHNMTHLMTDLVFQIAVIIVAARVGGIIFEKIKMPSVLGELTAGIIIGPFALGSLPLLGFEHGIFPLSTQTQLPISPQLYGIATLASIILLFIAGLETNLKLFLKYSFAGTVVGASGVIFSFVIGSITGMLFLKTNFMDPRCLFLGVMSTATSVGITARILSGKRKMESAEGVTILAGAVIDDVLGIILLAIVIGISVTEMVQGGSADWGSIALIAIKAVGVWLGFTIVGLLISDKIAKFLKLFKNKEIITVLAFGISLLLAGFFEKAGLAMIIGAYVTGLSFSKTDLSFVLQEKLETLQAFFVPIFFAIMGMMVDLHAFGNVKVLIFGFVYALGAIIAKLLGCGLPSLFLNFNKLGSARIGMGMVPRGEVALIIAGIGLTAGILDEEIFGVSIIMTLVTTIVSPPILDKLLSFKAKGTRKDKQDKDNIVTTEYDFEKQEYIELTEQYLIKSLFLEGFFINRLEYDGVIYQIRLDETFITMSCFPKKIIIKASEDDLIFINTLVYESFLKLNSVIENMKNIARPEDLRQGIISAKGKMKVNLSNYLSPQCIILDLKPKNKEDIIEKLVKVLYKNKKVTDFDQVFNEVMEREKIMSTGMANGLAIPHARTDAISKVELAIGFCKEGFEYESIDGNPSKVFILVVSSTNDQTPHIQILSGISSLLYKKENIESLLKCKNKQEVWNFFRVKPEK